MDRRASIEGTEVRSAGAKGRGVFATRAFVEDELVEEAHVILEKPGASFGHFKRYTFDWSALRGRGDIDLYQSALALGNGSLYNSANPANLRFEVNAEEKLLRFVAVRAIQAGEELTINYSSKGGGATSDGDKWFEDRGIRIL